MFINQTTIAFGFYLLKAVVEDFFRWSGIRRKPVILQLPVTSRCNSQCKTCNVWKNQTPSDIDPTGLRRALSDRFFADLRSVGINGGELTLVKNIDEIIDAVLEIKKLKSVWIISNCLLPRKLLELLARTKEKCMQRGVSLGVTFSVDGIGETDNFIRGVPTAYARALEVLTEVANEPTKYCDVCDIGCTVSKYNADHLPQVESFLNFPNIPIYFHLAVPNKRIGTFDSADFSVLGDEHARQVTAEFFYGLFSREKNLFLKFRHWANYVYLTGKEHIRVTSCDWLYRNVTIDENLNFYLCATASDRIGSLKDNTATQLLKSAAFKQVERSICPLCDHCIHYSYTLSTKGIFLFLKEFLGQFRFFRHKFKIGILWQKLR